MATDQLDARITDRDFLPGKGAVGFGLDFAVRVSQPKKPEENRGAVGEFFWDGAASTLFWIDPANHLAAVFFTQKMLFAAHCIETFGRQFMVPVILALAATDNAVLQARRAGPDHCFSAR
jgi:CubicO group peptidase (beta-lactamase class C family)